MQEAYISDMNSDLINAYQVIKDSVDELILELREKQDAYLPLDSDRRKEYFYAQRETFNAIKHNPSSEENRVARAALMIYLNKTCFNGLYRVNSKGDYNVPMGSYKQPLICDEENLLALSKKTSKRKNPTSRLQKS